MNDGVKFPQDNGNAPKVEGVSRPPAPSAPPAKAPESADKKKPLIAVLFEAALKYENIKFDTEEKDGAIVYAWDKTNEDDKIVYEIVVNKDSTFSTSAKVNSTNTTRTLSFNNADESQNIVSHAIKALASNNDTK